MNFNAQAQCTPSRSAVLTARHPIRSGTQTVPIAKEIDTNAGDLAKQIKAAEGG